MQSVLQQIPSAGSHWLHQFTRWALAEWKQIRISRIQSQSRNGDSEAEYRLALLYESGEMHPPSPHTGLQLLTHAAFAGVPAAQVQLAFKYKDGNGVLSNAVEAVVWFRKAAEMGHAEAQFQLGQSLAHGIGCETDLAHGIRWLRRAVRQGHGEAADLLSILSNESALAA
ncbi:MAG: Sel1 domain protein repeat-containing protein [Verrucomicrobiales bacterium]|nr:Sel1 domain protein repeat-containing protein [Verrucomicrobiales bacterium]